jgi:hypothetical protein
VLHPYQLEQISRDRRYERFLGFMALLALSAGMLILVGLGWLLVRGLVAAAGG